LRTCHDESVSRVAFLRLLEIHRMVVVVVHCRKCGNDRLGQLVVKLVSHSMTSFVDRVSIEVENHALRSLMVLPSTRRWKTLL
jgi:hypothetical protein